MDYKIEILCENGQKFSGIEESGDLKSLEKFTENAIEGMYEHIKLIHEGQAHFFPRSVLMHSVITITEVK